MMGNFFNRMYYGKGNKRDYTKDDLPTNRWQLFLNMVRLNLGKLVGTNMLFLLCALPAIIWIGINMQAITYVFNEGGGAADAMGYVTVAVLFMPICIMFMGPGTVGMTYVTRNMSRDQNVWVWADFWGAVKANWKQMLAVSAFNGVALVLAYYGWMVYGTMGNGLFFAFAQTLLIVFYVIWSLMNLYIWPLMISYDLKLKALIKNALLLTIARLPHTIFMGLFTAVLPLVLLLFITNMIAIIVIFAVYVIIGFALCSMAINSITNGIFDKYINIRIKGAPTNQGLRIAYDDDEDDDDEEEDKDEDDGE